MILSKEGSSFELVRDAMKKEAEMSEAEHQVDRGKIDNETDSKLVRMDEETRNEKEPELGEGEKKMKVEAEMKVPLEEERKGQGALINREERNKKRVDLKDEEKDVEECGSQSNVDAKHWGKQKKLGKSSKNLEKGEEGKKEKKEKSEKKAISTGGHPEGEKKIKNKDKKSKSSSERIQKKLDKINAKIDRILAKKEEYELRLKEAQERERQESEKAALQGGEASTTVMGKSPKDNNGPGLECEESIVVDGLGLDHGPSVKDSNIKLTERGSSGSLSRTASLIEVTPAELLDEVAGQKRVVEKLAKLLKSDGSEANTPVPMEDSDVLLTGNAETFKHTVQVDGSLDS